MADAVLEAGELTQVGSREELLAEPRSPFVGELAGQNLLRARFRDGFEKPVLMQPGQIYPFAIEMFPISNVFKKGHRIRVTVSSSSFPKWYPNGNTGREMDDETAFVVATNTIYHDAAHPSRIVLPVVPDPPR